MSDEKKYAPEEKEGGSGGRNARAGSGLSETRDARLTRMAVKQGWLGDRFPTREGRNEMAERIKESGDIDAIDMATLTSFSLMDNADPRNKRIGASLVIAMESQNQRDQISQDIPTQPGGGDVTINVLQQVQEAMEGVRDEPSYVEQLYSEQRVIEDSSKSRLNGNGSQ